MKVKSLLITSCLILNQTFAQDEMAYIRIVNCTHGKNVMVALDEKSLWAEGYASGESTGGIAIKSGNHEMEISQFGQKSLKARFEIEKGKSFSLVIGKVSDGKNMEFKAYLLPHENLARGLHFFSFCPETIQVKFTPREDKPGKILECLPKTAYFEKWNWQTVLIKEKNANYVGFDVSLQPSYWSVLWNDENGGVRFSFLPATQFE